MAIVVPFGKAPAQRRPMPDETFVMSAAALMHENGRLVQPETKDELERGLDREFDPTDIGESEFGREILAKGRRSNNIEDRRDEIEQLQTMDSKPLEEAKP